MATCTVTFATKSGSPHSITAPYGGDTNYNAAAGNTLSEGVNSGTATNTVTSSQNPTTVGTAVTYTATLTAGGSTPTGSVTFKDGGSTITSCGTSGVVTLTSGVATCTVSAGTAGSHLITAPYAGDGNYNTAAGNTLVETVNAPATQGLVIANGAGTKGQPDAGDTISVAFNSALNVSTLCAAWNGNNAGHSLGNLTVNFSKGTGGVHDAVTYVEATSSCATSNFGSVDLGISGGAFSGGHTLTFSNSTVAYAYNSSTGQSTLTVTLGTLTSGTASQNAASVTATWSESGIQSGSGAALSPATASETAEIF